MSVASAAVGSPNECSTATDKSRVARLHSHSSNGHLMWPTEAVWRTADSSNRITRPAIKVSTAPPRRRAASREKRSCWCALTPDNSRDALTA